MANEAIIIELLGKVPGRPIRFTCADAAMPKGTICTATDPRIAVASSADNQAFMGIASQEVAGDGQVYVALYTHGIFTLTNDATASITTGLRVNITGANTIGVVAAADLLFSDVGIALQAIAKSATGEVLVGSMF